MALSLSDESSGDWTIFIYKWSSMAQTRSNWICTVIALGPFKTLLVNLCLRGLTPQDVERSFHLFSLNWLLPSSSSTVAFNVELKKSQ